MPTLYVVATPIGNLGDISLRALKILTEVDLIAAEDTRKTKRLLNKYDIRSQMTSYHEHNKMDKLDYILDCLEKGDVALVSEAGTPGVSDPGYELVVAAAQKGITVVPVPGASAIISALSVSGLPTDRFTYLGFLPRKAGGRRKLLESVRNEPGTMILLESPHRLESTLQDMLNVLGDRRIAICRELTKLHEVVFRGKISESIKYYAEPRGEFTLVVEGNPEINSYELTDAVEKRLSEMRDSGLKAKEAIATISGETGLSRKVLYNAWLRLK